MIKLKDLLPVLYWGRETSQICIFSKPHGDDITRYVGPVCDVSVCTLYEFGDREVECMYIGNDNPFTLYIKLKPEDDNVK